ncbi:class I SAM-dependent methyltransferase [Gemmatirosa kalamazoonensis]|uniref:class I SAM-dependent methyltransferase n=1 Tax=Gemmatirosa kalamazoonensis TaxID=861299 RepID=UPI00046D881B|nr:class I SAM-dependent methyltransferase [Gemmatirosa kalamazoonensis]
MSGSDVTFSDHFSGVASTYAEFRPSQPEALIQWVVGLAPRRDVAWDCATGSGQAARALAEHFARVIATDASDAQLAHAASHERVTYRVATAEASGIAAASVDLVTVAQALHWFDLDAFYREVRRVRAPGGALAVWSYMSPHVDDPALDALLQEHMYGRLGPYWPPERRLIEEGYRTIAFPFDEVAAPAFNLVARWTLAQLAGYMRSWSATVRYVRAHGRDPIADFEAEARAALADGGEGARTVTWRYAIRAGY